MQEDLNCQVYASKNLLYSAAAYLEFFALLLPNSVYSVLKAEVM